jgi:hypothetical protein
VEGGFHEANLPLREELWFNGSAGVVPINVQIASAEGLCDWGEVILAEGLHDGLKQAASLLMCALALLCN